MKKIMKNDIKKQTALSLRNPIITPSNSTIMLTATAAAVLMSATAVTAAESIDELDVIQVEEKDQRENPYEEVGAPYKARISGDDCHVKDLADTPQNITVLTQTQIEDSGLSDLRDILEAQPGITLGTGENGNAFGDRYIIRGHEARSDVFVDGVRDPGMTTRESFATEQIEITKGPSSTFAGRGSTGGAINSVTKQASTEYDFNELQVGLGTDAYKRITLDSNKKVNDDVAVRANLLFSGKDIPDRSPADKERTGVALSGAFRATKKLNFTTDFYYLKAEDTPDMGRYLDSVTGKANDDIPVYVQDSDFLNSEVKTLTFGASYDFTADVRLKNTLRYGETDNGYVTTSARGTNRADSDPAAPGADTITLSSHQGWQDVDYLVNQTNLYIDKELGNTKHQFVVGFEYSDMNVKNGTYNLTNNGVSNCVTNGRGGASDSYCLTNADGSVVDNIGGFLDRDVTKGSYDTDYSVETLSLSLMDTITFNDKWSVFLGARVDDFDYRNDLLGRGATDPDRYSYSDTLFNGHIGAVYNFNDKGNAYLTFSTSSNINGGESDTSGCGYGGVCSSINSIKNSEPENTRNIELGTKWNVMDDKLLLTASAFEITKTNVMESASESDYDAGDSLFNDGENRVTGIEVSAVGNITEKLSTQFGAAVMNSEVLKSGVNPDSEGLALANFAEKSLFLQVAHKTTPKLTLGGGVKYTGKMIAGQPDTGTDSSYVIPSSTVVNAFARYNINKNMGLRLNVNNLFDEGYYTAGYRSGALLYKGDARNATLTFDYEF